MTDSKMTKQVLNALIESTNEMETTYLGNGANGEDSISEQYLRQLVHRNRLVIAKAEAELAKHGASEST